MPDINSTSGLPLKNKNIVITRPKQQASALAKNIQKVGGCTFLFPLIEITPLNDVATKNALLNLDNYDLVVFVSVNAVRQCIHLVGTDILKNKMLVCTGKKTANALIDNGLNVDFCPDKFFNSEALLSIEAFKKASVDKKIAIIRGASGRDYLKNNLISLGATVDYIDVYKRHCPQKDLSYLKTLSKQQKLDAILLTSASSTASFFEMVDENDTWINELTLLIGSSRMQHEIPDGFKGKILLAEDPSDETLYKTLLSELI